MEKVKISKDGSAIDFVQSDKIPVSLKKFRQSPELEGFYRFIFENDLRKEALHVIDRIYLARKAAKLKKPLAEMLAEKKIAAMKLEAKVETVTVTTKEVAKKATPKQVAVKAKPVKAAKVEAKAKTAPKKEVKKASAKTTKKAKKK